MPISPMAATQDKRPRYDLDDPANGELADFCEAMDGASPKVVLRNAFAGYRAQVLAENPGIARRYEELQRRRSPSRGN